MKTADLRMHPFLELPSTFYIQFHGTCCNQLVYMGKTEACTNYGYKN